MNAISLLLKSQCDAIPLLRAPGPQTPLIQHHGQQLWQLRLYKPPTSRSFKLLRRTSVATAAGKAVLLDVPETRRQEITSSPSTWFWSFSALARFSSFVFTFSSLFTMPATVQWLHCFRASCWSHCPSWPALVHNAMRWDYKGGLSLSSEDKPAPFKGPCKALWLWWTQKGSFHCSWP